MWSRARTLPEGHPLEAVGHLRTTAPAALGGAPDDPVTAVPEPVRRTVLAGLCLGAVAISLDLTIVNVALPTIGAEFGGGAEALQWIVSMYSLSLAVFLVPAGRLVDVLGPRRIFLVGAAIYAAASVMAGLAPDEWLLIAARIPQGLGAALISPAATAMIALLYEAERRGKVFGLVAGLLGAAAGVAPLIGGLVTDAIGWRAIFLINVPLVAAAALLVARAPRSIDVEEHGALDLRPGGTVLLGGALVCLQLALIESGRQGLWPFSAALVAVGIAGLVVFRRADRRHADPLVDVSLLSDRVILGSVVAKVLVNFSYYGALLYLVLYMQGTLGLSATATGLVLLPSALAELLTSPAIGKRAGAWAPRPLVALGLGITSVALLLLAFLDAGSSIFLHLLPGMIAVGIGYAFVNVTVRTGTQNRVSEAEHGRLASLSAMAGKLAGSFGVAFAALVFHSRSLDHAEQVAATEPASLLTPRQITQALAVDDLPRHIHEVLPDIPAGTDSQLLGVLQSTYLTTLSELLLVLGAVVAVGTWVAWLLLGREASVASASGTGAATGEEVPEPSPRALDARTDAESPS